MPGFVWLSSGGDQHERWALCVQSIKRKKFYYFHAKKGRLIVLEADESCSRRQCWVKEQPYAPYGIVFIGNFIESPEYHANGVDQRPFGIEQHYVEHTAVYSDKFAPKYPHL